jgi:anthranilate phosphoribosyltransferase
LVAASCGVPIAKHGNRAVSSKCGSADLLESLGVNLNVKEDIVKQCIESANFGFLFAPAFHPAMKYAMPTRKELGIRTIFNILGPLTNPAFAKGQILGVFSKELVEPMALVLAKLGISKGFVFHSEPGIDEIVPLGNVYIAEIKENIVNFSIKSPEEFGFPKINVEDIKSGDLEQNTRIAVNILSGKDTSIRRDIIILNTAYAILTSGIESDMDKAKEMAKNAIEKGLPIQILKDLIRITKGDITKLENLLK